MSNRGKRNRLTLQTRLRDAHVKGTGTRLEAHEVKRVIDAFYNTTPARAEAPSDDLRTACQALLDDYQTSDAHHPDHVLIRRADFERIKALVEAPVFVQGAWGLVRQAHEILRSGNPPFSAREVNARGKLRNALNLDRTRTEALDEGAAGEREASQKLINERDKWIVELIRERDALVELVRTGMKEAVPDALIFGMHTDEATWRKAKEAFQAWLTKANAILSHPSPPPAAQDDRLRIAATDLLREVDAAANRIGWADRGERERLRRALKSEGK